MNIVRYFGKLILTSKHVSLPGVIYNEQSPFGESDFRTERLSILRWNPRLTFAFYHPMLHRRIILLAFFIVGLTQATYGKSETLYAGVGREEITDRSAGPVNDPSFVKAIVLRTSEHTAVLVTVDAVAIGGIGRIPNEFMQQVRKRMQLELNLNPNNLLVNASHCHSVVQKDCVSPAIEAIRKALQSLEPVRAGVGTGHDDQLSENRRLVLHDGRQADMRRAYSLPPDKEIAKVGPIDPQVVVVRLDRSNGRPLAVLYHFACHPIMGAPAGGNTAGFPGFASQVIEEQCGRDSMAFFIQGCAGDINPIHYKSITPYKSDEVMGQRLGLKVLQIWRGIPVTNEAQLNVRQVQVMIPWAEDFEDRIAKLDIRRQSLLESLKPTDINFKSFVPLWVQSQMSPDYPSDSAQAYLHESMLKQHTLSRYDATIKSNLDAYEANIRTMEELTRLNVNRALLVKNRALRDQAEAKPINAELIGLRIGEFRLITFPGELTVDVGLGLKKKSPPFTCIAGYTNGYHFYMPTVEQRGNLGFAQEDCDCVVSPLWQAEFEESAHAMISGL